MENRDIDIILDNLRNTIIENKSIDFIDMNDNLYTDSNLLFVEIVSSIAEKSKEISLTYKDPDLCNDKYIKYKNKPLIFVKVQKKIKSFRIFYRVKNFIRRCFRPGP